MVELDGKEYKSRSCSCGQARCEPPILTQHCSHACCRYTLLLSRAFAEDPRDDHDQAADLQRDLIDLVRLCRPHLDEACIQAV